VVAAFPSDDIYRNLGGRPVRFRVRHLLYLIAAVSLGLGIPGLTYILGWLVFPWLMFVLIVGPILFGQFLFILLIRPLRQNLFGLDRSANVTQRRRYSE
jgi:hypothetical protein